jgi:hypothetical protein
VAASAASLGPAAMVSRVLGPVGLFPLMPRGQVRLPGRLPASNAEYGSALAAMRHARCQWWMGEAPAGKPSWRRRCSCDFPASG